ncbi:hypothetical protein [Nocardia sp. NPDC049526]|uniref:hypothetical protein n=1 Tax=Nocardia sp. NPDC049526 TaxID=3364316 RepID=UPI0037B77196
MEQPDAAPDTPRSVIGYQGEPERHSFRKSFHRRCHIGRPTAWPDGKIDHVRLLREQGNSLGEITSKTGIPKTSLHRYLTPATEQEQ